ncbi:MAG: hypothetical protein GC203_06070 [Phenylobacterium sp.]|uniref:Stf0 family sulfotransferase n=1 Tax=Phenylobacterium sp. TaxID=1871053 RepID=UPI0025F8B8AB|nr:Stf0 family sulfotransferase [Phenylobacterium sp.]MBI1197411.1 hypothetical protein [Phenylobacterium sp.]
MGLHHVLHDRLAGREHNSFYDRLPPGRVETRYLIATAGRAGSTLLCSRIGEYGVLGFPDEFLNEAFVERLDLVFPQPNLDDFEAYVSARFVSPNGVFGLKSDWWRFDAARRHDLCRSFYEPLDLVVYLWRDDFVAQAVSYTLAVETQQWHARDAVDGDLETAQREVPYDGDKVETAARNILNQEHMWSRFLAGCDAPVIRLSYEALTADPDEAVARIGETLGVDLPPREAAPRMRKGRSGVGREWRERFAAERGEFIRFWNEHRGTMTASA